MTEHLQEYVDSRGVRLRVDRATGVLRGVKLIGLESLNGRRYRPAALADAITLYEGAKVNVNHPKDGPLAPRDYRDRLGVIRQVEFRAGEGLFGNLHFNPKHALAEQLAWDAENNPRNVGFSHNVLARLSREGEQSVVEAITHVQSVDLVADPAATQGLFEQEATSAGATATASGTTAPAADAEAADEGSQLKRELQEALDRERLLRRQLRMHEAVAASATTGQSALLRERIGAALFETLLTAPEEAQFEALLGERLDALRSVAERRGASGANERPRSAEPLAALREGSSRVASASDFVRAIKAPSVG